MAFNFSQLIGRTILTSVSSANSHDASTTNHPSNMPVQESPQSPPLLASPATPLVPIRKKTYYVLNID
ncbi:hypothetical protein F8M41_016308 [Gigaspora margarita]|uniref:Uncharacterized protein n=1 Tax=Gigaspora margarita TaxID=4874 RepID=A0A8H4APN4_GIGMA|nr:hypothetical protein F8M41_016308 [Gigaspora margarita]